VARHSIQPSRQRAPSAPLEGHGQRLQASASANASVSGPDGVLDVSIAGWLMVHLAKNGRVEGGVRISTTVEHPPLPQVTSNRAIIA